MKRLIGFLLIVAGLAIVAVHLSSYTFFQSFLVLRITGGDFGSATLIKGGTAVFCIILGAGLFMEGK